MTEYALWFSFEVSNNQAEYEALLVELRIAKELGMRRIKVFTDSQLVAEHAREQYKSWESTLVKYLQRLHNLTSDFDYLENFHISRLENFWTDILSQLATFGYNVLDNTYVKHHAKPSIDDSNEILLVNQELSWINPFIEYLTNGNLPTDSTEACQVKWLATRMWC